VDNHIIRSPVIDEGLPLFTDGLLLCAQKTSPTRRFRSLGPQRVAKMINLPTKEANIVFEPGDLLSRKNAGVEPDNLIDCSPILGGGLPLCT
jgi:hypothetical protein